MEINKESIEQEMHKVWAVEMDILQQVHKICIEYGLKYSLAYGSLIGAVRHQGFIPWDDDIDIMMPREDYNKLIDIWCENPPKGYILENLNTNFDCMNNFTKIRKNNTTFLQFECEKKCSFHKGIFIDVFPMDRVPDNKLMVKLQYLAYEVNLLYSRGYTSGTKGIVGKIERIFLRIPIVMRKKILKKVSNFTSRWNDKNDLQYVAPCTLKECKRYYPCDIFENLRYWEFNGNNFLGFEDADFALKLVYGDYMKLPPEEERVWKHHPLIVDFEKNYEELEYKDE